MNWPDFDWKNIGNLVAGVAPTIAGALAGPFGPVASIAVTALVKAVGLGDDATPDDLQAALMSGKPELLLQLRTAEQDFELKLKQADIDIEKVYAGDRDSARRREMEVKDKTPAVLAAVIVTGFFVVLGVMAFVVLPIENKDAMMLMVGGLIGSFAGVIAYYFGSSPGQQQRSSALTKLAGKDARL